MFSTVNPIRQFRRYVQISRTLVKCGFGEYIKTLHPGFLLARIGLSRKKIVLRPLPQRLRIALSELGPTFIKIGQFASSRTDILPEEFTNELAKLQDSIKPTKFSEIEKTIEQEIGPINTIFEEFNKEPIGSASIAQVYLAKYKSNPVIVKVKRPGIERMIETDIVILKMISKIAERNVPAIREGRPERLIDTFARNIRLELDFLNEGNNVEKFRGLFRGDKRIYIPLIYPEISTSSVLIQEYVDGVKISDINTLKKNGIEPKIVAENGAEIFLKPMMVAGFFHADPHPGNIFVRQDNVIVPVDFGLVGRLTPRMKNEIINLLTGMVEQEPARISRALLKIGVIEDGIDAESLNDDIMYIMNRLEGKRLSQISVAEFMGDVNRTLRSYHIRMPQDLLYLSKALSQIESIGRTLDPDFDTIDFLRRFIAKNNFRLVSIKESLKRGRWWFKDMIEIMMDLPENLNRLFDHNRYILQSSRPEQKTDKQLAVLLSGFGIMVLSIFVFLVSNLPIFKFLSILGIIFSFITFVAQIFLGMLRR